MTTLSTVSPFVPSAPGVIADTPARLLTLAATVATPALLLDPQIVAANYRRISAAFPHAHIFYAVKANPDPSVLTALASLGCGLDVASGHEVALAAASDTPARHICFSAPFKRPADIRAAYAQGIRLFVADSAGEVENIARHAPGVQILIRMAVSGGHSVTPMGKKFGANPDDMLDLLELARDRGLQPYGIHFHVGSQCLDELAWSRAIAECAPIWHAARVRGMDLRLIDIGGGFPVRYDGPVPEIEAIAAPTLAAARVWLGPDVEVALEPGRWMTLGAATLVAEVIGTARRGAEDWVYLDAGVYNGLIDTSEGVNYPKQTLDEAASGAPRARARVTLAGPSCDGNDVMARQIEAPALSIGDRVLLGQAGAYTTAFERFNGLSFPQVVSL